MKGRIDDGWTYGSKHDETNKKHPSIIPYEDLSEDEKEYDRRTALGTISFLLDNGWNITKNS